MYIDSVKSGKLCSIILYDFGKNVSIKPGKNG
jgi:hypothetical protein